MSDNLADVRHKDRKKRLISNAKTTENCRFLLKSCLLDERKMCVVQQTTLNYPFTKLVGSPVSKVCPVTIITHLFNDNVSSMKYKCLKIW